MNVRRSQAWSVAFARTVVTFAPCGLAIAAGCAPHALPPPMLAPTPRPGGAVFAGGPPARLVLDQRALGVSPDGLLRYLVRAHFLDARGAPVELTSGGDVAFAVAATGKSGEAGAGAVGASAQWQTRMRFGGPAAIVSLPPPIGNAPRIVTVHASVGVRLADARIVLDPRAWRGPRAGAAALGPHAVQLGWIEPAGAVTRPRSTVGGPMRITRDDGRGPVTLGFVAAPGSTFRDTTVRPGRRYRYRLVLPGASPLEFAVATPPEVAGAPLARLAGKAMWLSFSPSTLDPDSYTHLDVAAILERARASGIRSIVLRVAYGPFWEVTADARPIIDALLDGAAARGIAIVAWTVPRGTDADDLANAARAAAYRSARGTRFAALSLDLERGDEYLGSGTAGYAALAAYPARLREALGPRYPIVATVEDPYFERLTNADVPYRAIAAEVDAIQPMAYWRMLSRRSVTPAAARRALRASYAATRRAVGRDIPIDIGGQTAAEGPRGAPPPAELAAAVSEARALGAFGITFFDWNGTTDAQWSALAKAPWRTSH